jgi:hypothetical protein
MLFFTKNDKQSQHCKLTFDTTMTFINKCNYSIIALQLLDFNVYDWDKSYIVYLSNCCVCFTLYNNAVHLQYNDTLSQWGIAHSTQSLNICDYITYNVKNLHILRYNGKDVKPRDIKSRIRKKRMSVMQLLVISMDNLPVKSTSSQCTQIANVFAKWLKCIYGEYYCESAYATASRNGPIACTDAIRCYDISRLYVAE